MNGQPLAAALPVALPDEAADRLAALFDAHHDRVYRLARRLAPGADEARDLVQETFLKAARSLSSVPAAFAEQEAWLVRVLINVRRDQWRKSAVRARHDIAIGRAAGIDPGHEAAVIARATVWRALDILPPRRRAVLVMHELDGIAIPAIAKTLGITSVTVRWHLSIGRRDLARILTSHTGESDEKP